MNIHGDRCSACGGRDCLGKYCSMHRSGNRNDLTKNWGMVAPIKRTKFVVVGVYILEIPITPIHSFDVESNRNKIRFE